MYKAGRQEAFDAELTALRKGIQLIAEKRGGSQLRGFTDSQVAIQQVLSNAPGPGQSQATLTVRLAEIICQRGSTVDVRWVPGHSWVEGNDQTDQHARGAGEGETASSLGREMVSLAFPKSRRTEKAHRLWREDIAKRNHARKTFRTPAEGVKPSIRWSLKGAPRVSSSFLPVG